MRTEEEFRPNEKYTSMNYYYLSFYKILKQNLEY